MVTLTNLKSPISNLSVSTAGDKFATIDDNPVAMCVALPDLNEIIRDLKGKLFPFGWAKLLWRISTRRSFVSGTRVLLMGEP